MKPKREITYSPFDLDITPPSTFRDVETMRCKKCNWETLIDPEHVDYRSLYNKQVEYTEEVFNWFIDFIDRMATDVVGARIWIAEEKERVGKELRDLLEGLEEDIREE